MEKNTHPLKPLIDATESFAKSSVELYTLKTISKSSKIISTIISRGIVVVLIFVFLFTLNIGVALWLGDVLGKVYYGFFCVAGFYGLAGAVVYFFMNDYIKKRVSNSIISELLN